MLTDESPIPAVTTFFYSGESSWHPPSGPTPRPGGTSGARALADERQGACVPPRRFAPGDAVVVVLRVVGELGDVVVDFRFGGLEDSVGSTALAARMDSLFT